MPIIGTTGGLTIIEVDELDELTDVTITSPSSGQSLVYKGTTKQWVNVSAAGGGAGTVTSVSAGIGLTGTPNPITTTGEISLNLGRANTWTVGQNITAAAGTTALTLQGDVDGGTGVTDPLVWKNRAGTLIYGSLGGVASEGMFSLTGDSTDGATGGQVGEWNVLDRNRTHFGSDKRICSLQVRNLGMHNDDTTPYDLNISQAGYGRTVIFNLTQQRTGLNLDSTMPVNTLDVKGNAVIGNSYAGVVSAYPNSLNVQDTILAGITDSPSARVQCRSVYVGTTPDPVSMSLAFTVGSNTYANGDVIDIKAYAYNTSPSGGIYYSAASTVASYTATSDFDVIAISLTVPAGMLGVRLHRQINGGGYTDYADLSPSGTYNDDNTTGQGGDFGWASGSGPFGPLTEWTYAGIFEGGFRVADETNDIGLEIQGITPIYFTNNVSTGNVYIKGNGIGDIFIAATIGGTIGFIGDLVDASSSGVLTGDLTVFGVGQFVNTITAYNGISTAGLGVPAIYKNGRLTAKTAAQASVAAYTVGAADGSFEISANVLVTTATLHNFTVTCAYTDEGNTARTMTLPFSVLAGTFITAITNAGGAVPYEGIPVHIRCKAGTTITIATVGTFTTVTYNVEAIIKQLS